MTKTKLWPKLCPFCGGEAILESNKLRYGTIYSAYCQKCGAEITRFSEHKVVAAWNRRAQPENEPLTLSELYDIDSEPLYFHCMVGHWSLNGWHIVKAINYDGAQFKDVQLDNNDAHIESLYNYGITWLAYRAKPERSEG